MRSLLSAAALLVAPAAAVAEEAPICTVPAGKLQLESNLIDWIGINASGPNTDIWQVGGSVLKLGLTDHSDLQLGFTPFVYVESGPDHLSGIGDVVVRYKHRLTGNDSTVQLALIPFVKLPTAKHALGNGKVEGGLAVPVSISTDSPITIVLGPELDLLADSNGDGRHLQLVNLVNLSGPIAPRLTLVGELWTATNFDPADTVTQASADVAVADAASSRLQLDLGTNVGLNRHTADIEIYGGISLRF